MSGICKRVATSWSRSPENLFLKLDGAFVDRRCEGGRAAKSEPKIGIQPGVAKGARSVDIQKLGPKLDVMSAEALFAKVVRHNARVVETDPRSMIDTRLVLTSGVELTGRPLDVDQSKNAIVASATGLSYVNVSTLSVLEVLDPNAAASLITNEPPPPPSSTTPIVPTNSPARSELRAELDKLNIKMERRFRLTVNAEVLDDATLGDVGKNQFVEFLEMLDSALTEIGSNDVGEITVGSLDQILLAQAPDQLAVKRSGELLLIAVPFTEPFESTLSARLHTELQTNL